MSPLLLLACASAPPAITAVSPEHAKVGDSLDILGANFQEGLTGSLGGQPLALDVKGPVKVVTTVPALSPGAHELVLSNPDGQSAQLGDAVTVPEPPQELTICSGAFTAYSQFAAGRSLIKIDRHTKGVEEPERLEIRFDEVEAVEYEGRQQGDAYCSAIVLRLNDGQRVVYEDSRELNFKSKAQEMAQAMARPVDVIHEDEVSP